VHEVISSRSRRRDDETVPGRRWLSEPSESHIPWRPVTPRDGESVRWECVDGRWISIGLASGELAGMAMVQSSGLICEYVETFEDALALARRWRTT
jgi:hypothetical protein